MFASLAERSLIQVVEILPKQPFLRSCKGSCHIATQVELKGRYRSDIVCLSAVSHLISLNSTKNDIFVLIRPRCSFVSRFELHARSTVCRPIVNNDTWILFNHLLQMKLTLYFQNFAQFRLSKGWCLSCCSAAKLLHKSLKLSWVVAKLTSKAFQLFRALTKLLSHSLKLNRILTKLLCKSVDRVVALSRCLRLRLLLKNWLLWLVVLLQLWRVV